MAVGMLLGSLAAIVRSLVAPVLARVIGALAQLSRSAGQSSAAPRRFELPRRLRTAPLALHCAERAPPIAA
ncbi:MAG: hypothetical protein JOY59_01665 [Candidatus Eremiobacteraeota bacterium]|nr:hypothetical protein [Candidatus Eremiobacteraeota bacterium]